MLPHTATQKQLHTQSRRSHFTNEKTKAWGGEPTCLDLAGSSACQAASVVHREAGTNTDPRGGCGSVTLRGAGIKHADTGSDGDSANWLTAPHLPPGPGRQAAVLRWETCRGVARKDKA